MNLLPPLSSRSRLDPASDFASAAMVRVLAQGMREQGLDPTAAWPRGASRAATVSLDEKRRLVDSALVQGGFGCLALLGKGLHHHADEPTHSALVSAPDVPGLMARWTRLERYVHSRHHVEVLAMAVQRARIVHRSRPGSPPPLPAEDLVVLGVLVALIEAIGATAVAAWVGEVPVYPDPDRAALEAAAGRQATADWSIGWTHLVRRPCPAERRSDRRPDIAAPQAWPDPARRSFATLSADLMSPLTLTELARAQGLAPRSLQRRLGEAGLSYTQLLAEARCRTASSWLMSTKAPVAEIGFLSGYADQAHFTRDFRSRVGLTPLRFRNEFSSA